MSGNWSLRVDNIVYQRHQIWAERIQSNGTIRAKPIEAAFRHSSFSFNCNLSNFDYIPLTQFSFDFFLFFLSHFFQRRVCSVAKIVEPILTVFYIGNILAMCIPMISIQWAMVRMNIVSMLSCVTCGHNSFNISIFSITREWQ